MDKLRQREQDDLKKSCERNEKVQNPTVYAFRNSFQQGFSKNLDISRKRAMGFARSHCSKNALQLVFIQLISKVTEEVEVDFNRYGLQPRTVSCIASVCFSFLVYSWKQVTL